MTEQEVRIRAKAHEIWLMEGMPEGREADHWFQAQEFIRTEDLFATVSNANTMLDIPVGAIADPASECRAAGGQAGPSGGLADERALRGGAAPAGRSVTGKVIGAMQNDARRGRPALAQWSGAR